MNEKRIQQQQQKRKKEERIRCYQVKLNITLKTHLEGRINNYVTN